MSTIGKIQVEDRNGVKHLQGYLTTLQFSLNFALKPNRNSSNANAPHYVLVTQGANNTEVGVGSAWKKVSNKKPGEPPFEFLSLTLDDPSFPHPLNVAAFPNDEGGYDITFRRRMDRKAA